MSATATPPQIGPLLGSGNLADAYAFGPHVLKLYRPGAPAEPAFREAATLALLVEHGLPVPAVHRVDRFGERWGLVIDRAPGEPLALQARNQPQLLDQALAAMVALQLRLHETVETRLPSLSTRLADRIAVAPGLDEAHRAALVSRLGQLPRDSRLCHGDFHPFNLVGPLDRLVIIDWLDATSGPPAADACRTYLLLLNTVPGLAEAYLALYGARSGRPRDEIMAWLPLMAAARLAEGILAEAAALRHLARLPVSTRPM